MSTTGATDVFGDFLDTIHRLSHRAEPEYHSTVLGSIADVATAVDSAALRHDQRTFLKLMLSSAMIDTAADAQSVEGLTTGESGRPFHRTLPDEGGARPERILPRVAFPQPEAPSKATMLPG